MNLRIGLFSHKQDTRWWECITALQRCSRLIPQPQPTEQDENAWYYIIVDYLYYEYLYLFSKEHYLLYETILLLFDTNIYLKLNNSYYLK